MMLDNQSKTDNGFRYHATAILKMAETDSDKCNVHTTPQPFSKWLKFEETIYFLRGGMYNEILISKKSCFVAVGLLLRFIFLRRQNNVFVDRPDQRPLFFPSWFDYVIT